MRTLVLSEDAAHPSELTREGLAGLGKCSCEFEHVTDPDSDALRNLANYPFIIFSKANQVSASNRDAWANEETGRTFAEHVRRGNAILFLHSGTALYKDLESWRNLLGGVFVGHPPQCPVIVEPDAAHPLTEGGETFMMQDEHYQMEMVDPNVDLFMTTRSKNGSEPAGWTRSEGEGRVCVLTPGHNLEVWHHPPYQAVLRNCIDWCIGERS